jgi:hypothetical protein
MESSLEIACEESRGVSQQEFYGEFHLHSSAQTPSHISPCLHRLSVPPLDRLGDTAKLHQIGPFV